MKRISLLWLAAVVAAVLAAGPAVAQQACETDCGACDDPCAGGAFDGCLDGDGCCDAWLNPCTGITAMGEVVWLRYQDSEPDSNTNDFQTGSRFTLGYMGQGGRELRVRYFEAEIVGGTDPFWSFQTFDIEYARRFRLGDSWRGDLALGVRDAGFHEGGGNEYDDTFGPLIGMHLETDVLNGFLTLYGNARYSHQFGHDEDNDELGSFSITELQIGVQADRRTQFGTAFVRTFLEAQQWAGVDDNDSEDGGLIGGGIALGLTR